MKYAWRNVYSKKRIFIFETNLIQIEFYQIPFLNKQNFLKKKIKQISFYIF